MTRVTATWLVGALMVCATTASAQEPTQTPPAEVHEHVVVDGAIESGITTARGLIEEFRGAGTLPTSR